MAKIKGFSHLLNEEGQPISGADISIYLANSSTPAKIYTSETGTTATSAVPQLTTDADGYFEFWLGYSDDPLAYDISQKFKISGSKTGVTTGYNDYISIIPATAEETWEPVNEEGYDTTRNKTVSDNLARGGEDHRVDLSYYVHGLSAVNVNNDNITKNALVSNYLAKGWEDHKDDMSYYVHGLSAVDETDTDTTHNKLVSNYLAKGWEDHKDDMSYYVHGIEPVETDTNSVVNKLISNYMAYIGEVHRAEDVATSSVHGLSGAEINDTDTTKNKLVSNYDLYNIHSILDLISYTTELSSSSLTASAGDYFTNINHNLGDEWPSIVVYDKNTRNVISPVNIISIDTDVTQIGLSEQNDFMVKVIAGHL